jgi:AraC-like DNA-binding protein
MYLEEQARVGTEIASEKMNKLAFSTDELPPELARFTTWRDMYLGATCRLDVERHTDLPFATRYAFLKIGELSLTTCESTIRRIKRTPHHLAADPRDDFFVKFNGARPWTFQQRGRSYDYAPNAGSFISDADQLQADHAIGAAWQGVMLPRSRVCELAPNPEDLVGRTFDTNSEAARHLRRYIEMLLAADGFGQDDALRSHVEATLLDLIALVLEGRRDATDLAHLRGLRAARLQNIIVEIRKGFADPGFSTEGVAHTMGVSRRYLNDLLQETGSSFAERVLELRLQKARTMLASPRNDKRKVGEIALACGFNEVSYFHRCFRRRFGASPAQFRERE